MGKSTPKTPDTQTIKQENIPDWLKPSVLDVVGRARSVADQPYTPYPYERIAGFTPAQQQVQQNMLGMQAPNQFAFGSGLAAAAGQGSLQAGDYNPAQFTAQQIGAPGLQQFQMGPAMGVSAQQVTTPQMGAAQTGYQPQIDIMRQQAPDVFGQQQAQQYMSPYMQNVMDVQKREAVRDAQRGQLVQDLGAARQGTYGGSRQLLAGLERERQLGQRLGDIQATGQQAAYESAQAQFERDRAAGMTAGQTNLQAALQQQQLGTQTGLQAALANLSNEQQARVNNQALQFQAQGMNQDQAMRAALANQGVDVTRAQADQQAALQTQQLGTQTGLQTALANLDAASQTNVQNLAAQLQTQGLNADQALRAALANQQAGLTVGQQNLQALLQTQQLGAQTGLEALRANQQAALEAQRLGEQSRQFGSSQGLAGLAQAGQMAQTLGNLGQYQQQADIQRLNMMQQAAGLPQALEQQRLDQFYADFLRQRDYPQETLGFYSNVIRGLPAGSQTSAITYRQPTNPLSYLTGGLGTLAAGQIMG